MPYGCEGFKNKLLLSCHKQDWTGAASCHYHCYIHVMMKYTRQDGIEYVRRVLVLGWIWQGFGRTITIPLLGLKVPNASL